MPTTLTPAPQKAPPALTGWTPEIVAGLLAAGLAPAKLRRLIVSLTLDEYEAADHTELKNDYQIDFAPPEELRLDSSVTPLLLGSPDYPPALSYVSSAPVILFARGDISALAVGVAIVGTRKPSSIASATVPPAVYAAERMNAPVHSGLALGVDAMAHRAALRRSLKTVAVLATHPTNPSPDQNKSLAEEILDAGGALVSEQLPSVLHRSAPALVARNRIIAGLSAVTVPAEAGLRSGTMGTISAAIELARPVVTPVPGLAHRDLEGAKGLMALAGLISLDEAGLRLSAKLLADLKAAPTPATYTAETPTELISAICLAFGFSPAFANTMG